MVQIETLPNGVRIVTEPMDTVRSAALGIWVGGGSREEAPSESGAAHFIEHMLFKGTQRRSAQDIARETDAIGGQMNAFTTKECTCFYGRVLDSHLPQALISSSTWSITPPLPRRRWRPNGGSSWRRSTCMRTPPTTCARRSSSGRCSRAAPWPGPS